MIGSVPKPFDEVLQALDGATKIGVVGCGGCAKVCETGGEPQVQELAARLREAGKDVVLESVPERTCYVQKTHTALDPLVDAVKASEALLVLGCGGAVQITRQVTEEYGLTVPVKTGLDAVGHMDTIAAGELALEQCQECGDCVLNSTGGICPVTKCAKSLLNGPCGGQQDGKCEVDPERDCAWILIYERMKALGEEANLRRFMLPKKYSKMAKPRTLHIKEGRVS